MTSADNKVTVCLLHAIAIADGLSTGGSGPFSLVPGSAQ
jgi:hypothetical protein